MRFRQIGLAAVIALASSFPAWPQTYTFEVFQVPYPPEESARLTTAQGIDNFGRVVGDFQFDYAVGYARVRGYIRHPGGAFEYPIKMPNDNGNTDVVGINTSGTIAGTYYPAPKIFRGFVRTNGLMSPVAIGDVTEITDMNDRGDLLGIAWTGGVRQDFLLLDDGTRIDITLPESRPNFATALAWDRTVVGWYHEPGVPNSVPFVRGPKGNCFRFRLRGMPEARGIRATGISNAAGKIVGNYYDSNDNYRLNGFVWDYRSDLVAAEALAVAPSAGTTNLPFLTVSVQVVSAGQNTELSGINARGQIVGTISGASGTFGFVGTPVE